MFKPHSTTQNLCLKGGLWRYDPPQIIDYAKSPYWDDDEAEIKEGLWNAFFEENLRWLEGKYLVDIGCGAGHFVNYANSHGRNCVGVDENPINHIHIMSVPQYFNLNLPAKPSGRMRLVLEHVPDPFRFLTFWRDHLKQLLIIVPNEFNPLQLELTEKYGYSPVDPQHSTYFTPYSLRMLCNETGWTVVKESSTFPMELWCRLGFNYIQNPALGLKVHRARLKFETSLPHLAFRLYKYWYDTFKWGRELVFLVE